MIASPGMIYVIGFSDSSVKVGFTADPVARLYRHGASGNKVGAHATTEWVSAPHENAGENEQALIAFCASRGMRISGNEWFSGVAAEDVITYAKRLPMHPVKLPMVSIEEARRALGDLVLAACHTGQVTIISRNGKPAARIIPIPDSAP